MTIKTSKGEFLFVEPIKGAREHATENLVHGGSILWATDNEEDVIGSVELPSGSWSLLCRVSEVTEDVAKGIVEDGYYGTGEDNEGQDYYVDYDDKAQPSTPSAPLSPLTTLMITV